MKAKLLDLDEMGNELTELVINLPEVEPTPRIILDSNTRRAYYLVGQDECYRYASQPYLVIRGSDIMLADRDGMIKEESKVQITL